ncbi:MAG: TPM domain-containing protein [Polaromonas sp.]|nr:TPM domain-containing protein [Polaromonas sp.]
MTNKFALLVKHLWLDADDARRVLPPAMLDRLAQRVAASETRHTGQIRIYAEASLPQSYLWRLGADHALPAVIRERALSLFGKLGVWDTEQNNGVLIYLLLAEHAIEIVADRGLARHVTPTEWSAMVDHMSATFRDKRFEEGLTQALDEVSDKLAAHFPITGPDGQPGPNELPDAPVLG